MTGLCRPAPGAEADIRIHLLHVPECPLVGKLRTVLQRGLARSELHAEVEELEGPYPSPTLLVNGVDVTGREAGNEPSCRLDLPGEEQILTALIRAADRQSGQRVSSVDDTPRSRSRP